MRPRCSQSLMIATISTNTVTSKLGVNLYLIRSAKYLLEVVARQLSPMMDSPHLGTCQAPGIGMWLAFMT